MKDLPVCVLFNKTHSQGQRFGMWSPVGILTEWRRWCSGIMQDSHSCDPGSIPGRRNLFFSLTVFHMIPSIFSTLLTARVA